MALTISVLRDDASGAEELSLTLDAPRIVIGRSKSCEVLLLDPSVSARHACIRREGGRNLIVDEGSTNGIRVDNVQLPAHTPRVIHDGEVVRVGRVWLKLELAAGVPSANGDKDRLALELLRRDLLADGEAAEAELRVVSGPDEGASLPLSPSEREYRLGRSREADLVLSDEHSSRVHALVTQRDGRWWAADNGSKRGSLLEDQPLGDNPVPWPAGGRLTLGDTVIVLHDPLPAARTEALSAPDLRMSSQERDEPPPGATSDSPAPPIVAASESPQPSPAAAPAPLLDLPRDPRGAGYISVDMVVILIALTVIGLSGAALWWVLG